jgi:hypothetical protein
MFCKIIDLSEILLQTSWKPEGKIMNGQSRDAGNIGYKTQNEDKQNKKQQKTTQKNKKINNKDPTKNNKTNISNVVDRYCNEQVYFIIMICVFCNRSHCICMEKN